MKKSALFLLVFSAIAQASEELPPSLKKYQDAGVLSGGWICRQDATVFVGQSWVKSSMLDKRTVINEIRAKCADAPETITFQSKNPFQNIARWTKSPEGYSEF